jgi:hypothetical protein
VNRAILTLACGKPIYWEMAVQLARSFEYWNSRNEIGMYILSDTGFELPKELRKTSLVCVPADSLGPGFSAKLHLDRFLPAEANLFIDADCLCLGPLDFVFERFAGHSVSVVGGEIRTGEWFGDVASICSRFAVPALPKFNGGIYYIAQGQGATAVYELAREMEPRYDEFGLIRLRGQPNDELLMAIAMARMGCCAIPDDGSVIGDLFSCPEVVELDVPMGRCVLRNPPPPDPQHRPWFLQAEVRPTVVHFLGHHPTRWPYQAELVKLRALLDWGFPPSGASIAGSLYSLPYRATESLKSALRPIAHACFGPRAVKPTFR